MQPSRLPTSPQAPVVEPAAPPAAPAVPEAPRKRFNWFLLLALAAAAGAAYWFWQQQSAASEANANAALQVRSAAATTGVLGRTIRLTGVTTAEEFVSIVAPQMRGSRSGRGRDVRSASLSTPSLSSVRAGSSGGSNSSSSVSTASSLNSGGGGSGDVASSGGGGQAGGRQSQAMRSATSRVGGGGARASNGGARAASSIQTGAASLGSTGDQLGQGMGGGMSGMSGGGEFSMTLQHLVKPGSRVGPGEVVAEFDRQYMLTRLEDYKSSVAQYESNMRKLRSEVELYRVQHAQTIEVAKAALAKAELDMKTLPVRGEMDAERLRLALQEARAQLKQLESEVKFVAISTQAQIRNAELDKRTAELELKRSEMIADRMLVKSPIGGITVMQQTFAGSEFRQIQQGDQIYPGMFFMQVVEPGSMVINAVVNQVDADRLRIGAKARIRVDAYPGLELPGHLVSVGAVTKSGGSRASFVKEIPVRLKIDRMDPRVIPDLSVSCDVMLEPETEGVLAPREALQKDVIPGGVKYFVWVRGEGGNWTRREVELGPGNHTHYQIRSGLKAGEVIALDRPPAPADKS
jgi:membrane fusion protein (multidrug efflux system)